jgi:hypothetical protein
MNDSQYFDARWRNVVNYSVRPFNHFSNLVNTKFFYTTARQREFCNLLYTAGQSIHGLIGKVGGALRDVGVNSGEVFFGVIGPLDVHSGRPYCALMSS